jgi:hypothetical protein
MGPLRTPRSMRSDERLFFYVAAGLMLVSIVYTLGWHVFPLYEVRFPFSLLHSPPVSSSCFCPSHAPPSLLPQAAGSGTCTQAPQKSIGFELRRS